MNTIKVPHRSAFVIEKDVDLTTDFRVVIILT